MSSSEYNKEYYRNNKEKWPKWTKKDSEKRSNFYNTPEGRITYNLARRKRILFKKEGITSDILIEDLLPLPIYCPILNIKLNYGRKGENGPKDNSPSIDRIDSSKGYIKGNVQIISQKANQIKSNATAEEIRLVANYLERLLND